MLLLSQIRSTKLWCNLEAVFYSQTFTRKFAALMSMSQFHEANLREDVEGEIERQKGGHPKLFANREKRHCITLVTESLLGTASATTKQL